jgi:hypothetical protein
MWILECDDKAVLDGARMWLRPGTRCVLGRVKHGDGMWRVVVWREEGLRADAYDM